MIKLRKYNVSDRPELIKIFRKNVPRFFGEEEERDLTNYLDEFEATYYIASTEETLVGAGGYILKANEGWLSWYLIDPDYQRTGAGTTLVRHAMEQLKAANVEEIKVNTSQHAAAFFARFGFVETLREKDYWAEGLDLVAMHYAGGENG